MSAMEKSHLPLLQDPKFRWLIVSLVVVGLIEIFSLGGWHLPPRIGAPFLAFMIIVVGHRTLRKGLQALIRFNLKSINLLMIIAVCGAFYLRQFEEAAVVIVLFTLGERLEDYGIETSKSALQALIDRSPKTAEVKNKGEVQIGDIGVGEILIVKPSDRIAMDGVVVTGTSSVDESMITGEPLPHDRHPGDEVFAGTLNLQGYLEVRVTRGAQDSTLARIVQLTFDASKHKARTQKFIEKFSAYYTPSIMILAVLMVLIPTVVYGKPFNKWFEEALTLLVIACPCALVISTPISIYSAIGNASSRGALVKGGKYIEAIGKVAVVALDKTRTLTYGKPVVVDVLPFGNHSKEHLLACAAGIELYSEHPLAQSIVDSARNGGITAHAAENFQAVLGKGAKADCVVCYDRHHCVGKLAFISEEHTVEQEVSDAVEALHRQGKTSIVVSSSREVEGIIAVTDEIRPQSKPVIAELRAMGVQVSMLTGDHSIPAQSVAQELGISDVRAELLPEDKVAAVTALARLYGEVAMVGDGVNDAPALALASVGIAMGATGSDTAIEASSIAIMNDRLEMIPFLIALGRKTISTIKINTSLAVITKLAFVALALAGISSLALAIFADVGVTVLVILNSLKLLRFDPKSA